MLKFEWNALRNGDKVLVHDPRIADLALRPGVVTMIESRRRINNVGIRVGLPAEASSIVWPSYVVVHLDPRDETQPCWRCEELASTGG